MKTKAHPNFQDLYSVEDIKKAVSCLKETAYYPISLIFSHDQVSFYGNTGNIGRYDLNNTSKRIYTLKAWYAVQVWNIAIAIASSRLLSNELLYILPHWVDRDDSFKMLENNEKFTPDMVDKLWKLLEEIANSGDIKVHEGYFIENKTKGYWGGPSKCYKEMQCKFTLNIIVDVESVYWTKFKINNLWEYQFCKQDKSFKWDDIKDMFCEVSLSVRELINNDWMHKCEECDEELFYACNNLDLEGVKLAIEKGANVNAIDNLGETPLANAIEYYRSEELWSEKNYTEEEAAEIEKRERLKLISIIDYLLEKGADINLFGYEGRSPIVAAYYAGSPKVVEYLLKKGANPNVNCYLTDVGEEKYRCTILGSLYENPDDYTKEEGEIEDIVKQYGGRLYYFGYNPIERQYIQRTYLSMFPNNEYIFKDSALDNCGDYKTLRIEIADDEFIEIDISSVEGLEQWHNEFIEDYCLKNYKKTEEEWNNWFDRGLQLAKQVKALLPDNVDLYYLYDQKPLFRNHTDNSKFWACNGKRILVE